MIQTADPITFQLAALIGAVMIALGLGGWRDPGLWARMLDEMERSPGLTLAIAFVAILFGAIVLLLPGGWSDPLAIVVSAIGLAALAKGLVLLAVPGPWLALGRPLLRYARAWAALVALAGALLFLAGLSGTFS